MIINKQSFLVGVFFIYQKTVNSITTDHTDFNRRLLISFHRKYIVTCQAIKPDFLRDLGIKFTLKNQLVFSVIFFYFINREFYIAFIFVLDFKEFMLIGTWNIRVLRKEFIIV